ncbi:MAG: hypothetical protein V9G13_08035 [Marmoricola sp.]
MSDNDPRALGGRILDLALAIFFAAMALYGAVLIVQAIWIWLCVGAAVFSSTAAIWWILRTRF